MWFPVPFIFMYKLQKMSKELMIFQTTSDCFHRLKKNIKHLDNILRNQFTPNSRIRQNQKTDIPKKFLNTNLKKIHINKILAETKQGYSPLQEGSEGAHYASPLLRTVVFPPCRTNLLRVTTAHGADSVWTDLTQFQFLLSINEFELLEGRRTAFNDQKHLGLSFSLRNASITIC